MRARRRESAGLGEHPGDKRRKSTDLATENSRKHLSLAFVGALVDEDAGGSLNLTRPQITLPSPNPDATQFVHVDIAEVAVPDVPKQDRLAKAALSGAWAKVHGHATA